MKPAAGRRPKPPARETVAASAKAAALSKGAALPKGARRTTPSPETLTTLGPERLIGLILGETARNPVFRKLVSAALASLQGPEAVAAIIDRRLTALEGARGYIDWQKRRTFTADLDATVTVILNELRPLDPGAALDRLRRFLDGADAVLNRVDDGAGTVQAVFERASEAFVQIAAALPAAEASRVAAGLVDRFANDPFGPLGSVLAELLPLLPPDDLDAIDGHLAAASSAPRTGTEPATPAAQRRQAGRIQILRLRQTIADRRGDPDAFIALEGAILPVRENRPEVARRLLAAGRPTEALDWIRRVPAPGPRVVTRADLIAGFDAEGADRERLALEIEILDALGLGQEAQSLRWTRFTAALDGPMLRLFLAKLPDFEDEEALVRALAHAEAFPQPHRALAFLTAWPDLARAARLVTARSGLWQGDQYGVLAPAAEALSEAHPLAATILYRRLLDDILRSGRSAAYTHGARYLRDLEALADRLPAGAIEPAPAAYREGLRRDHGRKHAFWNLVGD